MSKEEMIQEIEGLYPIDCNYIDTCTVGEMLLLKAIRTTNFDWREFPENVLLEYLQLCRNEEEDGEITSLLRGQGRIVE